MLLSTRNEGKLTVDRGEIHITKNATYLAFLAKQAQDEENSKAPKPVKKGARAKAKGKGKGKGYPVKKGDGPGKGFPVEDDDEDENTKGANKVAKKI